MNSSKNLIVNSSMKLLESMNSRDYQTKNENPRFPAISVSELASPTSPRLKKVMASGLDEN